MNPTMLPGRMAAKVKVHPISECWTWTGARNPKGYGSVANGRGGSMLAHRKAYEHIVGPIPDGLTIDHLCLNKACVNPAHMEPVTRGENNSRMVRYPLVYTARPEYKPLYPEKAASFADIFERLFGKTAA